MENGSGNSDEINLVEHDLTVDGQLGFSKTFSPCEYFMIEVLKIIIFIITMATELTDLTLRLYAISDED